MLSDKLLSKTDYNCDREIRTLELLKLRFGDANLHNCEVCSFARQARRLLSCHVFMPHCWTATTVHSSHAPVQQVCTFAYLLVCFVWAAKI